jgi:hypothetical protein
MWYHVIPPGNHVRLDWRNQNQTPLGGLRMLGATKKAFPFFLPKNAYENEMKTAAGRAHRNTVRIYRNSMPSSRRGVAPGPQAPRVPAPALVAGCIYIADKP